MSALPAEPRQLSCSVEELRTLFLFEKLSDDQLQWLCERGHVQLFEPGTVYAEGSGVERDLVMAIAWWFRAAEQGVTQAEEALARLRQMALGRGRRVSSDRLAVEQAFRDYRTTLWRDFPDLVPDGHDTVGGALMRRGRVGEAVPVLIREASALSEPAERLLETLYQQGVEGLLPAHDARIRGYFGRAAAEGLRPPTP